VTEVLHGYTMSDLDSAARIAVTKRVAVHLYDDGLSAVAEGLCAAEGRPVHFQDLVYMALRGVDRARRASMRSRGQYDTKVATGSQFWRYWGGSSRLESPWEDQVDDRLALAQVWACLTPRHRETLAALAEHGQYHLAAVALDVPYDAFCKRVRRARLACRELWHDGEIPAKPFGHDRRKHRGTRAAIDSVRRRGRGPRAAASPGVVQP
jgi:hypothetical protein